MSGVARSAYDVDGRGSRSVDLAIPGEWTDSALCAETDPELFFPEKGEQPNAAKAVCRRCPVAAECLEWALAHAEGFGVWGGLSAKQRQALLDSGAA